MRLVFKKTAGELAALTGGELEGDAAFVLQGIAGLGEAGPADVSFLGNPKYAASAASSKAGCLLLPKAQKGFACAAPSRILVDDPQWAFAQILTMIQRDSTKTLPVVDPKAVIHYEAKLGKEVSIGPYTVVERGTLIGGGTSIGPLCSIGENVRIGRDCLIHPRVVIREDCVIGDRVVIQPGAVIGGDGYGFSTDRKTGRHRKIPQLGNVVLEDDVEVGANAAIDRATTGSTVIGAGTKIDNLVMVAHNVRTGRDCLLVSQCGVSGSTTLGDRVILAGQAGLVGHLKIGDGAIVTAQSGVMSDVEPGNTLFGSPARGHREAMKLVALYGRLPELFEAVKEIKKKLGLSKAPEKQEA